MNLQRQIHKNEEVGKDLYSTVLLMQHKLYRFAKSIICSHDDAQDIVQDMYERLWVKRESLQKVENLEAFAMTSIKNMCCDRIRNQQMQNNKEQILMAKTPVSINHSETIEIKDMKKIAERAISELPEKQRMIMHLRDVEGYEIEEIAKIMEIGSPTIRVLLSRGRKKVKEEMIKTMNYGI